jgi:hypothetical protein
LSEDPTKRVVQITIFPSVCGKKGKCRKRIIISSRVNLLHFPVFFQTILVSLSEEDHYSSWLLNLYNLGRHHTLDLVGICKCIDFSRYCSIYSRGVSLYEVFYNTVRTALLCFDDFYWHNKAVVAFVVSSRWDLSFLVELLHIFYPKIEKLFDNLY